jgi:multisubunit Na+/H+ antiporter MnhF subunit
VAASLHPAASHHLPAFITAPGQTDVLMVAMGVLLLGAVLMFGILFLRLHSLPERMAHRTHKLQFEIVAVLCLLALFTHIHLFWVAALLLAMIEFPDIGGNLGRIAGSVEKIAGVKPGEGAAGVPNDDTPIRRDERTVAVPASPEFAPAKHKELSHA